MGKYRDVKSVGRSEICPFVDGEESGKRHRRRLKTNIEGSVQLGDWCSKHGIRLKVTNGGHHWQALTGFITVEWWPSSAKAVINKKWSQGIHIHDWKQFQSLLEKRFK